VTRPSFTSWEIEALRKMVERRVEKSRRCSPVLPYKGLLPADWRELLYKLEQVAREASR
jgi:hypothetical protein